MPRETGNEGRGWRFGGLDDYDNRRIEAADGLLVALVLPERRVNWELAEINRDATARTMIEASEMFSIIQSFVAHTEGAYDGDVNHMDATLPDDHPWRRASRLLARVAP